MLRVPANAKYCVYSHVLDGEVFYIGKGRPMRPFQKQARNQLWRDKTSGRDFEINILGWYETEDHALAIEHDLLLMLRPCCNISFPRSMQSDDRPLRVADVRGKQFRAKEFLNTFFNGPADLVRVLSDYGYGEAPYATVNKWWQRGRISSDWFPLILCALEIEQNEPVFIGAFIR